MDKNRNMLISRRSLLTGFAATAGIATLGTLTGCATQPAQESTSGTTSALVWDKEADIVIAGFGAAGGGSAAIAAEQGLSALILEKTSEKDSGGATSTFANQWFPITEDMYSAQSMATLAKDTAAARSKASVEAMDLMSSYGLKMIKDINRVEGGSKKFYEMLASSVKDLSGVTVEYDSPVFGLIQDSETGEVLGVRAEQGGKTIKVKANRGVVLATGGYEGSKDMLHEFHHPLVPWTTTSTPYNTGEGLMICQEAGARTEKIDKGLELCEFAYRKASEDMGTALYYRWYADRHTDLTRALMRDTRIFVNVNGQRFMNEFVHIAHNKSQLAAYDFMGDLYDKKKYKNMPFFMVFDDTMMQDGPIGKVPQDSTAWTWAATHGVYEWSDDNQAELKKGWIYKADTLEELAALMTSKDYVSGESVTVDAAGLIAAVEKYNAGCAAGQDEFGRVDLNPLAQPPYYAAELMPNAHYSLGGVFSNADSQVIHHRGEAIPRLYAAGNIGQGSYGAAGVAACMGAGMLAVRHAATLDSWDANSQ